MAGDGVSPDSEAKPAITNLRTLETLMRQVATRIEQIGPNPVDEEQIMHRIRLGSALEKAREQYHALLMNPQAAVGNRPLNSMPMDESQSAITSNAFQSQQRASGRDGAGRQQDDVSQGQPSGILKFNHLIGHQQQQVPEQRSRLASLQPHMLAHSMQQHQQSNQQHRPQDTIPQPLNNLTFKSLHPPLTMFSQLQQNKSSLEDQMEPASLTDMLRQNPGTRETLTSGNQTRASIPHATMMAQSLLLGASAAGCISTTSSTGAIRKLTAEELSLQIKLINGAGNHGVSKPNNNNNNNELPMSMSLNDRNTVASRMTAAGERGSATESGGVLEMSQHASSNAFFNNSHATSNMEFLRRSLLLESKPTALMMAKSSVSGDFANTDAVFSKSFSQPRTTSLPVSSSGGIYRQPVDIAGLTISAGSKATTVAATTATTATTTLSKAALFKGNSFGKQVMEWLKLAGTDKKIKFVLDDDAMEMMFSVIEHYVKDSIKGAYKSAHAKLRLTDKRRTGICVDRGNTAGISNSSSIGPNCSNSEIHLLAKSSSNEVSVVSSTTKCNQSVMQRVDRRGAVPVSGSIRCSDLVYHLKHRRGMIISNVILESYDLKPAYGQRNAQSLDGHRQRLLSLKRSAKSVSNNIECFKSHQTLPPVSGLVSVTDHQRYQSTVNSLIANHQAVIPSNETTSSANNTSSTCGRLNHHGGSKVMKLEAADKDNV